MTGNGATQPLRSWREALHAFWDKRVLVILLLGFSAGIPILLIFSSLSLWLGEAGIERKAVTLFSWAALGYSFKFVWAPLVDSIPVPFLHKWLGRRRSWLLVSQFAIMGAIVWMGMINPATGPNMLVWMAVGAVLLGFSSATQDIVIDAYRIEFAEQSMQPTLSSAYVAGYRVAMVVAGAGAIALAELLGSEKGNYVYSAWQITYMVMAAVMLIGVATTLSIKEPVVDRPLFAWQNFDYARMLLLFAICILGFVATFKGLHALFVKPEDVSPLLAFLREGAIFISCMVVAVLLGFVQTRAHVVKPAMVSEIWVKPIVDFFARYGWKTALSLLLFIGFYRISDIVAGVISNVFYQDMGFSKSDIATAVKTVGVVITILGGLLGGLLVQRYSIYSILIAGAVACAVTQLSFVGLAMAGQNYQWFYFAVFVDNFAAGFATAGFIAFLSGLTNVKFTASQYAIFSSLMTLLPKVIGGYSGSMVDTIGYPQFFIFAMLLGLPVIFLVILVKRTMTKFDQQDVT